MLYASSDLLSYVDLEAVKQDYRAMLEDTTMPFLISDLVPL